MSTEETTTLSMPLPNWYQMIELTHPVLNLSSRIHRSQDPDKYFATVIDLENMQAIAFKDPIHKSQIYFCMNMVSPALITLIPPVVDPIVTFTKCGQAWFGENLAYKYYKMAGAGVVDIEYELKDYRHSYEAAVITLDCSVFGLDPERN